MSAEVESIKLHEGDSITVRDDESAFTVLITNRAGSIVIDVAAHRRGMKYILGGKPMQVTGLGECRLTLERT